VTLAVGVLDAIAVVLVRLATASLGRVADGGWQVLHVLGTHRWRDGFEVNLERGWRRYRGSHCAICDVPWEGW
jgi:hypothetical protein